MRILGHIHTFNDEEIIDRSLAALIGQSRGVDGVVLVDNASTDRTLERRFPDGVTVIRHPENRGTSGAVVTGMRHGIEHGYDWIYLLDADSIPRPDAIAKLLEAYEALPAEVRERTWRLSSVPLDVSTGAEVHGIVFDARGCRQVVPADGEEIYECHATIWSGCLYRLGDVARIGLPIEDYVLDWGEYDYGYRGMLAGLRGFVHRGSVLEHSIGDTEPRRVTVGPRRLGLELARLDVPPIRLYYIFRNQTYFWVHVYFRWNLLRYFAQRRRSPGPVTLAKYLARIAVTPTDRAARLAACARGLRDGIRGDLTRRF